MSLRFKFLFLFSFYTVFNTLAQDSIQNSSNANSLITNNKVIAAPVLLKADTLFFIANKADGYPVSVRATEISKRLELIDKLYNAKNDSIYTKIEENYINVKFNDQVVFIVSENDAFYNKTPLFKLAEIQKNSLKQALNKDEELSTKEWLKRIGFFLLSLFALYGLIKLINLLFRRLDVRLSKIEKSFLRKNKNIIKYFIPRKTANIFVFISKIVRFVIIVIVLIAIAPFMFSFFPWAENIVQLFYGYISSPVKYIFYGFINFIPNIFFILIIAYVARFVVRVGGDIASDVELGKFKISNFHKDWARPTGKIFSILVYAISLVMIFPYLPGSGSSAFQGVSIFIGAIISFGSSSAIANIIAGVVITYMRPFQIGDRVKIDNIVGDVIDKTILVTLLRTTKNENVTIPNANILIGNIINFSNNENDTTILHTTITLGYDLPWQKAEELLIKAAENTQLILKDPKPFVLQTSLDNYYVSYELNAHINETKKMPFIYSETHKNILEVFNEAGVEILSPSYAAIRDGNLTTVPSKLKPDDKSPIRKIVDHLTGRNQKITITKADDTGEN